MIGALVIYIIGFLVTAVVAGCVLEEADNNFSGPEAFAGAAVFALFWPLVLFVTGIKTAARFTKAEW